MKKLARTTATMIFAMELLFTNNIYTSDMSSTTESYNLYAGVCDITPDLSTLEIIESDVIVTAQSEQPEVEVYYEDCLNEDLELLCLVAYAEAEGESDYGQRLVVDTILNRVDDQRFPSTVYDVVYDQGQFDIFSNNRINQVEPDEHIIRIVNEELNCRTNTEVLYFNSISFNDWSTPLFQEGGHYFSK